MDGAVSGREFAVCVLLASLATAAGTVLLVWEQLRWRRNRQNAALEADERRHEWWRMLRRTLVACVLVVGGPVLAIGWLTIDAVAQRKAFVAFWTAALAVLLALILTGILDALIMLRFGLKQSAKLYEKRLDALAEFARRRTSQAARMRRWPPQTGNAERN